MSTGEGVGGDARSDHAGEDRDRRGERIGIGGGDDSVTRIQLAARWAETYSPRVDSLGSALKRFRAAFEYLDSVTHGVEPPDLDQPPEAVPEGVLVHVDGGGRGGDVAERVQVGPQGRHVGGAVVAVV